MLHVSTDRSLGQLLPERYAKAVAKTVTNAETQIAPLSPCNPIQTGTHPAATQLVATRAFSGESWDFVARDPMSDVAAACNDDDDEGDDEWEDSHTEISMTDATENQSNQSTKEVLPTP